MNFPAMNFAARFAVACACLLCCCGLAQAQSAGLLRPDTLRAEPFADAAAVVQAGVGDALRVLVDFISRHVLHRRHRAGLF